MALEGSIFTGLVTWADIVATRHGDVEEAERHVGCRGDDKWWPRTWRRSLVNVIAELTERGVRCECQKPGCSCSNDADLILADAAASAAAASSTARTSTPTRTRLARQLSNNGGHPPFH